MLPFKSPGHAEGLGTNGYAICRSTAIEVALKMAMRKYVHDRPGVIWDGGPALHVVGLTNGYHGDTLGAMDAAAQSPYNDFNQTPWSALLVQIPLMCLLA